MGEAPASLQLYLLGTFRVVADEREVRYEDWERREKGKARRAQSLVKVLALEPQRRLHRERLIGKLYPNLELSQGASNLHRMVHLARHALEPALDAGARSRFVHVSKEHVSLEAPGGVYSDLEEFERLAAAAFKSGTVAACEAALTLYGGKLLPDDEYEDWVRVRREQTAALYHELLGVAAQAYELEGMRAEAVECYRRLTVGEPTDEEAHRQLMRLYALAGDRGQAARQYGLCEKALARELGEKPERATVELYRQISSGGVSAPPAVGAGERTAEARRAPRFSKLTSQLGTVFEAKCDPGGSLFVCSARWEGRRAEVYSMREEAGEWHPLGLGDAALFAVSKADELALGLKRRFVRGFVVAGRLARLLPGGGRVPAASPYDDVQWADFAPDGRGLLLVRDIGGRNRLEYPAGRVLYETGGWVSHPRFSPDGEWIAFLDHPVRADDRGDVALVPAAGGDVRRLTGSWLSAQGLAWSASGEEVWFTAAETGAARSVRVVSLSGAARFVYAGAGSLTLHDATVAGRLLLSRDDTRLEIMGRAPGAGAETKLSRKFHWALARDLSDDGRRLLLTEAGEGGGGPYGVYLTATDGSSVARLGDGSALALSPGGEWALAVRREPENRLLLLPTSGGAPKLFDRAGLTYQPWGCWFPCGRRVLFAAGVPGRGTRLYAQDIEGGAPVCVTPSEEGVELTTTHAVSPDGRRAAAVRHDGTVWLYDLGSGKRTPVQGLEPGEVPVRWDGPEGLYVFRRGEVPTRVVRVGLADGARRLWRELSPPDATGVHEVLRVLLTPDASAYVYTCTRHLSDLYLVEGLA